MSTRFRKSANVHVPKILTCLYRLERAIVAPAERPPLADVQRVIGLIQERLARLEAAAKAEQEPTTVFGDEE